MCSAHGGGNSCQHPKGCNKFALGSAVLCIAHGGGNCCQHPEGCEMIARGRTCFCIALAQTEAMTANNLPSKSVRGNTGLCNSHGGRFQGHNNTVIGISLLSP